MTDKTVDIEACLPFASINKSTFPNKVCATHLGGGAWNYVGGGEQNCITVRVAFEADFDILVSELKGQKQGHLSWYNG